MLTGVMATREIHWRIMRSKRAQLRDAHGVLTGELVGDPEGGGWGNGASLRHLTGGCWHLLGTDGNTRVRLVGASSVKEETVTVLRGDGTELCLIRTEDLGRVGPIVAFKDEEPIAYVNTFMSKVFAGDSTQLMQITREIPTQRYRVVPDMFHDHPFAEIVFCCGVVSALCRRLNSLRRDD